MKLLLTELQYQDPTSPMDTEKMLTQTSQLATLESQNATKSAMEAMTKSFAQSASYALAASIGKMAITGKDTLTVSNGNGGTFDVYMPTDIVNATIAIQDSAKNTIKTFDLNDKTKGVYTIDWDGRDANSKTAPDGLYTVAINYIDKNGNTGVSKLGAYPIESVKFAADNGEAQAKVGSSYMPFSQIKEIF